MSVRPWLLLLLMQIVQLNALIMLLIGKLSSGDRG